MNRDCFTFTFNGWLLGSRANLRSLVFITPYIQSLIYLHFIKNECDHEVNITKITAENMSCDNDLGGVVLGWNFI
jgi:hypothetical protein